MQMSLDLNEITDETLQAIQKAATAGVISSTGLVGFDLSGVVSLVPVNTPTYDTIAREDGSGSVAANWRALLNVNSTQPNPFTGLDGGGSLINISEQDMLAKYLPVRVSGKVTRDAVALAKNYEDAKGIASIQTLMQWRIQDNKAIIGGQAWALAAIGALTFATATTGGTIAATTTVHVRVAARSAYNYFWGGSGAASADASQATGGGTATNTVTATWAPIKGAVAYDVFVAGFYYTTVTAPTVTVTSVPGANAAVPTTLPGLFGTAPTAVPATDTSSSALSYNGIYASVLGDYSSTGLVTPGSGTNSGATWTDLGGAALTPGGQGVAQIDTMNASIYNTAQLSATRIRANARVMQEIGSAALGTNAAVTYLQPDGQERTGLTVGVNVARYINRITGESQELIVDPWMPDGSAVFEAQSIPYPNAGIANTFAVRTLQDVTQFDYGVSLVPGANGGPAEVWDQSSIETLICRAPMACGVITGIG
jgi:hypothetical protein